MGQINKYQGEDIAFSIKVYIDSSKTEMIDLDNVAEIVVYIYTDGCRKAMFSKTSRSGYVQLQKASINEYFGIIPSDITKLMAYGALTLEINIAESEKDLIADNWNFIEKAVIGSLKKSLIKIES